MVRDDLVDRRIGEAAIGANHGLADFAVHKLSLCRKLHEAGKRKAILALIQRADAVREFHRQHGNHAVREVYARAAV